MRNITVLISLGLLLALSLSSCIRIEEVEIKEIRSVKLLEFSDKGLLVESQVEIHNPNNYDIKIVNSNFNVEVNKKRIGEAKIDQKITIPASSSEFHSLLLRSEHKDLAANAIPTLIAITATGKDQLDFKVDGFIVGKVWWIKKKVAVGHSGKVDLKLF